MNPLITDEILDALTWEHLDPWDQLRIWTGHLVLGLGRAEGLLASTALTLASRRVPHGLIREEAGSWRIDPAIKQVRALLETNATPAERAELTDVLDHLATCNTYRNALAHSVTAMIPDPLLNGVAGQTIDFGPDVGFVASNAFTAKSEGKITATAVTPTLVRAAAKDVEKAGTHLIAFLHPRGPGPLLKAGMAPPWLFRFPQRLVGSEGALRDEIHTGPVSDC